jgi:hypothetical protein
VLADLDDTIRQLLIREVPVDLSEVDINFEAPDREWSGRLSRPSVNCFLYDVRENHEFRETDWDLDFRDGHAVRHKPPVRVDVSYHVTVWARAPEDEHQLLWRVLSAMLRHPVLPDELLQGALKDQPFPIRTQSIQPELGPKNAAELWQALENRIRPGLSYVATLALDPEVTFVSPLVLSRTARVLDGLERLPTRPAATEVIEIGGRVRDRSSTAIPDATILLQETGAAVKTDADGRFIFRRAPRGEITLVVRLPGRREIRRRVSVPAAIYPSFEVEV